MRGHIRRRGDKYIAVFYLGRDQASGKIRNKWTTHETRRGAEDWLARMYAQKRAGGGMSPARVRLGDHLQEWLDNSVEGRVAPTTRASYRETVRLHLTPALGDILLSNLSAPAIQRYLAQKRGEGLSPTTVRYHAAVLNRALGYAIRWGRLLTNPMQFVDLPKRHRPEVTVWDEEQIRLFLGQAKASPYYSLYLAAITTGMRQGELLGLRWKDVDLTLGVAHVVQKFYRLGGERLFSPPKNGKGRTVDLPAALIKVLRQVREKQTEQRLGTVYDDSGLVFCQSDGKPLHAHNVTQRDFKQVIKDAKVPPIRFHDLRHSHATLLLREGVHPKIVQERLGHSQISTTLDTYSHVLPGMQAEAAKQVAERLLGKAS